ncbi:MAG: phosphatidate cytidylyltransferase [Alphaproteobacteria bacterium]|nr:phosphatidate cytidylyltransferase [Alphaproteobacteria bacterium]
METQVAASSSKWADLGVRLTSAAVMIPAVIADVWVGGIWFHLFVALLAVLMANEWVNICHDQDQPQLAFHAGAAMAGALLPLNVGIGGSLIAIAVLWLLSGGLAYFRKPDGALWRYLGVPYVSLPAIALVLIRNDAAFGIQAIVWLMVTVWSADSLAYFAGRIIGGPKLAPVLSPKKTWAGLGGAMAGSALASAVFAFVVGLSGLAFLIVIAAALAVVEQAGDLFKSAMKRHYGVKDSGRLIPGHGGVIDRVDGLVAVASVAALIGLLRGGMNATGVGILIW